MSVILLVALVWSIVAGFALALLRIAAQGERATERQARERPARRFAAARRHSGALPSRWSPFQPIDGFRVADATERVRS
jgi:hypothetical protein